MRNGKEELRDLLRTSSENVRQYVVERRIVEEATYAAAEPATGKIDHILRLPHYAQNHLEQDSDVTQAAMAMAAIAYRGYLYVDGKTTGGSFTSLWEGTNLEEVAENSELIASEILPEIKGMFVECSIDKLKMQFVEGIKQGGTEEIVVTGLNGVGKSMGIDALVKFISCCGVSVQVIKFPRYTEEPLGPIIKKALSGTESLPAEAFQYLAIADALQAQTTISNTLTIYDRHPTVDPLVYAPERMVPVLLASRELFDTLKWVYVIDRHPAAAAETVNSRGGEKRIFEKGVEQMVDQVVRYATLTALPGCRWINNDIPSTEWGIELSKRRLVGAVITSGIIDRIMVKQALTDTQAEARDKQMDVFIKEAKVWLGHELS